MVRIELPGDVLSDFRERHRLSAVMVAYDTAWGTAAVVYNLESIAVQTARERRVFRNKYFPKERFDDLLRTYPGRITPSSEWPARFERAFERQGCFLHWGLDSLQEGWMPPMQSSLLPEADMEETIRLTIQEGGDNTQGLRGAVAEENADQAIQILREAMYVYGIVTKVLGDRISGSDDRPTTPLELGRRGDGVASDYVFLMEAMIGITRTIAEQFRLDAKARGTRASDLTEEPA